MSHPDLVYAKASKSAGTTHDAFEEFEEEFFDDDEPSDSSFIGRTSGDASAATGNGTVAQAKFERALAEVQSLLALSTFKLRAKLPSASLLVTLAHFAPPERLDEVIELWTKWRVEKGLVGNRRIAPTMTRRLCQSHRPEKALEILSDRFKYGADITDIREVDALFCSLSRPGRLDNTEGAGLTKETRVEQGHSLLKLCEYHVPEQAAEDVVGPLCVLAFSLQAGETSTPRVKGLLKKLRAMGAEELVQSVKGLAPTASKIPLIKRAEIIAQVLNSEGREQDAQFFMSVAEAIRSEWATMAPSFVPWNPIWEEKSVYKDA